MTSGKCGKNLKWTLDNKGTLTISGTGNMKNYSLYYKMAAWYDKRNSIKNIVIEEGVTSIGNWAFDACHLLFSVDVPDSVSSIGLSAFRFCTSITNVKIPDSVTFIGKRAFSGCTSLTNIKIPDNVNEVGESLFAGCKSLKEIYYKRGTKIDLHKLTADNNAQLIPYDELPPAQAELPAETNCTVYRNTKISRAENIAPPNTKSLIRVDENIAEIRRAAELAAMNIVMTIERDLGFSPEDVSSQNLGYDIKSASRDGKTLRLIEVKGRHIDAETVTVSRNEIDVALNNPDNFILAIVRLDGGKNETIYIRKPFEQPPDRAALSVNFSIQRLVEVSEIVPG